jgi:WD40 repeat protein
MHTEHKPGEGPDDREWLHEELSRLPERLRQVLILCHLEGKTQAEAALALGCPAGSVSRHLRRACELLRERLAVRGLALSTAALVALLESEARAALPAVLLRATLQTVAGHVAGATLIAGATEAVVLAREVLQTMTGFNPKGLAALLLMLGVLAAGSMVPAGPRPGDEVKAPDPRPGGQQEKAGPRDGRPGQDRHGDPLPEGAIARLGTTRLRPGGEKWHVEGRSFALALSPDGKLLATGEGGAVRFWEVATGKEIRSVALGQAVRAVVFSPDGKLFAAHADDTDALSGPPWSDHTIHVGEVAGGKVLHEFHKEHHGCREVAFSPDGALLAAFRDAEPSNEPRKEVFVLWDVRTGKELRQLKDVSSAAFTPDGKKLAVGKRGGVILLLDPHTGREAGRLEGHRATVRALAVSPDGHSLVSADEGPDRPRKRKQPRTSVRLWDLDTGKVLHELRGYDETVIALQFAPDGKTVAAEDSKGNLLLYDATFRKQRHRFPGGGRWDYTYTFSPDGKVLLLQEKEGPFREWDIARGEERRRWGGQTPAAVLVYASDGKVLASRGSGGLFVWDVAAGKELNSFAGHRAAVQALAFSPDGRFVASLDQANVFGIWEARTGKPLLPIPPDNPEAVLRFRFAADGAFLSAIGKDGTVRVWEPAAGMKVRQFRIGTEETVPQWVYGPDGKVLAVPGADNAIHLWDPAAGKELRALHGHQDKLGDLTFSPDGKLLASAGQDRSIRLWDAGTGKELQRFTGGEKESASFLFSPDGKLLAWSWGQGLHLWDVAAQKETRRLANTGAPNSFLRDGKTLAVADREAVHLWDLATGKELHRVPSDVRSYSSVTLSSYPEGAVLASAARELKPWQHVVFDVATGRRLENISDGGGKIAFSPDGKTLVQGGGALGFVEMLSGDAVGTIPGGHRGDETALAFSADGKLLATGGSDGTILLWDWWRASGLLPAATEQIGAWELEWAWEDLGGKSGKTAYRAIGTLMAAGDEAAAWLGQRLQPFAERDREVIRRLIAALDDDRFEERTRAAKELVQIGAEAEPVLRQALADKLPAEARRKVEGLLSGPNVGHFSAQTLRKLRAVQALEQIGTARAREVLEKLSGGIPEARLTREAADALERLARRR